MSNHATTDQCSTSGTDFITTLPCELFDDVLKALDFFDIYRCRGVNRYWRDRLAYLMTLDSMKQKMYLTGAKLQDHNPHLSVVVYEDDDDNDNAIYPVLKHMSEKLVKGEVSFRTYKQERIAIHNASSACISSGRFYDTGASQSVEELKRRPCIDCYLYHDEFRYDNLHPVLRNLSKKDICLLGYDSRIFLLMGRVTLDDLLEEGDDLGPEGISRDNSMDLLKYLASIRHQLKAYTKDLFIQPPCESLVISNAYCRPKNRLSNPTGKPLTLGRAVRQIVDFCFRDIGLENYGIRRGHAYDYEPPNGENLSLQEAEEMMLREVAGIYTDLADFHKPHAYYEDLVKRFAK
ncbi:hypothetical protein P154DRAFT_301276 [Amniculicola lignicola CBS 123094]|uniref:F-box domain-containing protein n=1 Tax=Amniculicola lignicola CBS 123094 TaxID=1392246 RepID=A0A6A5WCQ2_9PLEO|nr:hypothetical protein P154DRAFT_301276 [Amniculicola lignicola CBS 123094]